MLFRVNFPLDLLTKETIGIPVKPIFCFNLIQRNPSFFYQPTWQRNIFLILIRGYVELIINPVDLIYRLFITELRFRKVRVTILLLIFDQVEHSCNSRVITICVKKVITFCVGKVLHFALIILLHFALILLHFVLVLHFAAIVITFCVSITFCGVTRTTSISVCLFFFFFILFRFNFIRFNNCTLTISPLLFLALKNP